jgi:hypothetical protein
MEAENNEAVVETEETPTGTVKSTTVTSEDGDGGGSDPPTPPKNPTSMPVKG